jgi:hypothetical protein
VKKVSWFSLLSMVILGIGLVAWQNAAAIPQAQKQSAPQSATKAPKRVATDPCADTPAPQPGPIPTIRVEIRPDSAPPHDPDDGEPDVWPTTVCVRKGEQIEWNWAGPGSPAFSVIFSGRSKPFKGRYFHQGKKSSGKPSGPANLKKRYKYSVAVEGYGVIDPDVIIR